MLYSNDRLLDLLALHIKISDLLYYALHFLDLYDCETVGALRIIPRRPEYGLTRSFRRSPDSRYPPWRCRTLRAIYDDQIQG